MWWESRDKREEHKWWEREGENTRVVGEGKRENGEGTTTGGGEGK